MRPALLYAFTTATNSPASRSEASHVSSTVVTSPGTTRGLEHSKGAGVRQTSNESIPLSSSLNTPPQLARATDGTVSAPFPAVPRRVGSTSADTCGGESSQTILVEEMVTFSAPHCSARMVEWYPMPGESAVLTAAEHVCSSHAYDSVIDDDKEQRPSKRHITQNNSVVTLVHHLDVAVIAIAGQAAWTCSQLAVYVTSATTTPLVFPSAGAISRSPGEDATTFLPAWSKAMIEVCRTRQCKGSGSSTYATADVYCCPSLVQAKASCAKGAVPTHS